LATIEVATQRGIGLILIGFMLAMFAAWYGGHRFIRTPIQDLLDVTVKWRGGYDGARVEIKDPGSEIARLGKAFNEMADTLTARHDAQRRAEEQLRQLNASLEDRVEQRTQDLVNANRAKSQFLANMSHEIRTPMNGALGMMELLRQTDLDEKQRQYVETASRSGKTLLSLISGILDLSKIEAGKLDLEARQFDLRALLDEVVDQFSESAARKGLELKCILPLDFSTALVGDAGRLHQIFNNLLGNAIKFTERGVIEIRALAVERDASSKLVRFEVSDTGIGIPAEKRELIFDAFCQADGSTTRRYGGTGLGLTIAKQLCEMMGGSLSLTSEVGVGSTFRFTARFERGEANPLARRVAGDGGVHDGVDAVGGLARSLLLADARVLLVEDNPVNLAVAAGLIESFDCIVETAPDGRKALECFAPGKFDIIFMDCQMPEMDGFEATAEIRRREAGTGHRTPIVALTANAIEGDREACLARDMDDYLSKPATHEQFGAMLQRWVDAGSARPAPTPVEVAASPTAVAAASPEMLDGRVLDDLRRLQRHGRPSLIRRAISHYLESSPQLLVALREGAETGDLAVLERASHTLKSASASIGALTVSAHCRALEVAARGGQVPDAGAAVQAIIDAYGTVEPALAARLSGAH
jgi:signal transduction histidine kinase/CheY-like chemotaxis protein/HPt (histidine-containing phosphotransfer) domain-containing protein